MPELIQLKLDGVSSEVEHHRIAKIVKLASTQAEIKRLEAEAIVADKVEELAEAKAEALHLDNELTSEGITMRVSMPEYNYSVGLIMGRELVISAPPDKLGDLRQKILSIRAVKISG